MKRTLLMFGMAAVLASCSKMEIDQPQTENHSSAAARKAAPSLFHEVGSIILPGGEGAAEISAYDPATKKLFVVNNTQGHNRIDVVDLSNAANPKLKGSIEISGFGGLVNSVAVNYGKLAAAIEANNKVANGKVVVFKTSDHSVLAQVSVGALPDMVTFSPDGKYILSANEGEPNSDYSVDPEGSVSIIDAKTYAVTTLNFAAFEPQKAELLAKGLRIFGPGATFAQDIEPEYITVAANSKTAWVTLQENNAIARINLVNKNIEQILPLGFKNYNLDVNAMDLSDKDGKIQFNKWPVKGIYMPDAIAVSTHDNAPFVFTANEGDAREYSVFEEAKRVGKLKLDVAAFPNAAWLKKDEILGRLNVTTTLGDNDGDGDYDELYSFGARSFSVWHGMTGEQVFDSGNQLDVTASQENVYPDGRSDDKGSEPEGLAFGRVGNKDLLFVGMERNNSVAVYDVSNPHKPKYLQWLRTGTAPEGVLFVSAEESPTQKSLLIVSSEGDGQVKIYSN